MARIPASIRTKNPGAMWGNALAVKWGASKKAETLNDGKGQGNNIAVFPTFVAGICAQLDLWRTSKHYRNKRFADAIAIWSGHNEVESYIAFVLKRVPGMTRNTVMDDAFWRSAMGIEFLKAQAWHEAGQPYPAAAIDWVEAQRIVFGGVVNKPATMAKDSGKIVTGATATAVVVKGVQDGWPLWVWLAIAAGVIALGIAGYFTWRWWKRRAGGVEPDEHTTIQPIASTADTLPTASEMWASKPPPRKKARTRRMRKPARTKVA